MKIWPNNKDFAFTIIDDTDCSTIDNVPHVYQYLYEHGIITTKSVWIFDGELRDDNKKIIGDTCENSDYLSWVQQIKKQGFEIALHSASWSRTKRDRIIEALDIFNKIFDGYPNILVQHNDSLKNESLYWGKKRLSGIYRIIYNLLCLPNGKDSNIYTGEDRNSEYFWGDICSDKIKYVRNFIFPEINTLKSCSMMPYFDEDRPFVNNWFASSEAADVTSFNKLLSLSNQEKLENEGGACIVYTHLGKDFFMDGRLDSNFKNLISNLAKRNGWFVPASKILDFLSKSNDKNTISRKERALLERKWLWHKCKIGTS